MRFAIADAVPQIHGVRSELEQLVLNLVINACDAMPDGGELVIAVRAAAGGVVVLELTDTGTGRAAPAIAGLKARLGAEQRGEPQATVIADAGQVLAANRRALAR